jgi:hypothetical protein
MGSQKRPAPRPQHQARPAPKRPAPLVVVAPEDGARPQPRPPPAVPPPEQPPNWRSEVAKTFGALGYTAYWGVNAGKLPDLLGSAVGGDWGALALLLLLGIAFGYSLAHVCIALGVCVVLLQILFARLHDLVQRLLRRVERVLRAIADRFKD